MRDIYSYVTEQETAFKNPIQLEDGWWWNFKEHIRRSYLYKNSQFETRNEDRDKRPFKNVIRPVVNIHYRTEGFDVKDIELYVDNPDTYYKSFLIKKFHDKWALTNEMDTFIDEVVESFVDYGGVLVKNVKGVRPEVVDLRTLAFCDQTNILSGPFAIKHYLSPSELRVMGKSGWGNTENGANISIESLILKTEAHKQQDKDKGDTKTPGRYAEIYEIHNCSNIDFDPSSEDSDPMMYIIGFYKDDSGNKHGVCLFKSKEPKLPFKFLKRDPVQGRTLGFGAIEELFEPQVWTNFAEIHIVGMLEHASKVLYKTTDQKLKGQNLGNKKNGSVLELSEGKDLTQVDTTPRNLTAFSNYVVEMHEHASEMGAASDLFLGQQPNAGTPFKSVETQLVEGKSLHIWRQGRIAVFMDEIYRDWVLPQLSKEITKGSKFLSELSADEMMQVAESLVRNEVSKRIVKTLLDNGVPTPEQKTLMEQTIQETFLKGGSKRFFEILKDEMSDEKLGVSTNIAGKQKNLALVTDKVVNFVRQAIATPEIRQDPEMIRWLNTILEGSGLSPIRYSPRLQPARPEEGGGGTEPLKELSEATA